MLTLLILLLLIIRIEFFFVSLRAVKFRVLPLELVGILPHLLALYDGIRQHFLLIKPLPRVISIELQVADFAVAEEHLRAEAESGD